MPADPQQIQLEIEATRAELAATVEAIADKVSPKKVAARSVASVKDAAMTQGLNAYAAVENAFAPHPVPPAIPPLPLAKRVKWDRVGSVLIGLGVFLVALVSFRSRPAKWERKQFKLQQHDTVKLSRKAKKKAAKAQHKAQQKALKARHQAGTTALANLAAGRKLAAKSADQAKQAAGKQAKSAAKAARKQSKKAAAAGHDAIGKVKELAP